MKQSLLDMKLSFFNVSISSSLTAAGFTHTTKHHVHTK